MTSAGEWAHPVRGVRTESTRLGFVLLCAVLAAAIYLPVVAGSRIFSPRQALAVVVIAVLSALAGHALAGLARPRATRTADGTALPFTIVAGFSLISLMHLVVVGMTGLATGWALLVDLVLVLGLNGFAQAFARRHEGASPLAGPDARVPVSRAFAVDLLALALASVFVTLWTREALHAVAEAQQTGILRVWNDFLLQATEIRYIEQYRAFAGQTPYLADVAQPFYHRASYAMSAVFAWIARDGALEASTYFWLPVGMLMMGLGAYGLGVALAGRRVGLVAMSALFLLPDASMYGLRNGYFAFHWLVQVAPGAGYALALILAGLALYVGGVRTRRFAPIAWGAVLVGASALFRVHVAIPALALYGLMAFCAWRPRREWYRVAVGIAGLGATAAIVVGLEHIALAPHLISGQRDVIRYIEAVHLATPTAYEGVYPPLVANATDQVKAWIGYPLLVLAELGLLVVLLPLTTLLRWRWRLTNWRIDAIPYVLLLTHTAVTFLLPTPGNGDITEWSHRSFVLLYAVIVVMQAAWLLELAEHRWPHRGRALENRLILPALLLIGLVTPWVFGKNAQYGSLRDGPSACATPISQDAFAATRYIREHARPGDRMQSSDADPVALDVALTGQQAYVSRFPLYEKIGGQLEQTAQSRIDRNKQLANARTYEDLLQFGREAGVRWYLLRTEDMPAWPVALLGRAVYGSGNLRVFDLSRN